MPAAPGSRPRRTSTGVPDLGRSGRRRRRRTSTTSRRRVRRRSRVPHFRCPAVRSPRGSTARRLSSARPLRSARLASSARPPWARHPADNRSPPPPRGGRHRVRPGVGAHGGRRFLVPDPDTPVEFGPLESVGVTVPYGNRIEPQQGEHVHRRRRRVRGVDRQRKVRLAAIEPGSEKKLWEVEAPADAVDWDGMFAGPGRDRALLGGRLLVEERASSSSTPPTASCAGSTSRSRPTYCGSSRRRAGSVRSGECGLCAGLGQRRGEVAAGRSARFERVAAVHGEPQCLLGRRPVGSVDDRRLGGGRSTATSTASCSSTTSRPCG